MRVISKCVTCNGTGRYVVLNGHGVPCHMCKASGVIESDVDVRRISPTEKCVKVTSMTKLKLLFRENGNSLTVCEGEKKMETKYYVWRINECVHPPFNNSLPHYPHNTFEEARAEAERLARVYNGAAFAVVKVLGYAQEPKPVKPPSIWTDAQ